MTGSWIAVALLIAGVLVVVASALGALLLRAPADRLHLVAPVTTVAGPLIGAAVAIRLGGVTVIAESVLIVGLAIVTGAVLQAAAGHLLVRTHEEEKR